MQLPENMCHGPSLHLERYLHRPVGKGDATRAPAYHRLRRSTFLLTNDLKKCELIKNIDCIFLLSKFEVFPPKYEVPTTVDKVR